MAALFFLSYCHLILIISGSNDTNTQLGDTPTDNEGDATVISTQLLGGVAGGTTICICCCLFIFCWWRFKQMSEDDDEDKPNRPEESIGSSKFRRLFGLDESKRKDTLQPDATPERAITSPYDFAARERNNPHRNTTTKAIKSNSSPMPKIGNVTPANAMRALKLGNRTPGGPDEPSRSSNMGMPKLALHPQNSDKSIKSVKSNRSNRSNKSHRSNQQRSSFSTNSNMSNLTTTTIATNATNVTPGHEIRITGTATGTIGGSLRSVQSHTPGSMRSVYSKSADSAGEEEERERVMIQSGTVNDKLGIMNSINVKYIRNKKKNFEKVRSEGKKDVVIVERGFQHKNTHTHTYTTPNEQNHDTDYGMDDTSESNASHTPVLVAEIIGGDQ